MRRANSVRLRLAALAVLLIFCSQAAAQPGDCNSDGTVSFMDIIYLMDYLYTNGPPPDLVDCDCDGYPGVNYGDLHQLTAGFSGTVPLYPSPGVDIPMPCDAQLMVIGEPDGIVQTEAMIIVKNSDQYDGLAFVYSFAPDPGEAILNCTNVDFMGGVGSHLVARIDNVNYTIAIYSYVEGPSLPATPNWSLLAKATFTQVDPGTAVTLTPTSLPRLFPMFLAHSVYSGTNMVRVFNPNFMPNVLIGDADASGGVDIDDVVYMIAYIFSGGPPPGDPDDDGIPNW